MNQIRHLGGDESRRARCAVQPMLLQESCGFRQPMGQQLGGLKALKRHRPAVLPMQRETGKNSQCGENTQQRAVGKTMQSAHQGGASGDSSGGEGALNQLKSTHREALIGCGHPWLNHQWVSEPFALALGKP